MNQPFTIWIRYMKPEITHSLHKCSSCGERGVRWTGQTSINWWYTSICCPEPCFCFVSAGSYNRNLSINTAEFKWQRLVYKDETEKEIL